MATSARGVSWVQWGLTSSGGHCWGWGPPPEGHRSCLLCLWWLCGHVLPRFPVLGVAAYVLGRTRHVEASDTWEFSEGSGSAKGTLLSPHPPLPADSRPRGDLEERDPYQGGEQAGGAWLPKTLEVAKPWTAFSRLRTQLRNKLV